MISVARFYAASLQWMQTRTDISYFLLICAAEAFATAVDADFKPDQAAKREHFGKLAKTATKMNLTDAQVQALVDAACDTERWIKRKFVNVFLDAASQVHANPDDLWPQDNWSTIWPIEPKKALSDIYQARSDFAHAATTFPRGITLGIGPTIQSKDLLLDPFRPPRIPGYPWFERVFSHVVRAWLYQQVGLSDGLSDGPFTPSTT